MEPQYLNILKSKSDLVNYLNKNGYFWERCNMATESVPDDELILKSLLSLEFEDMPQLFNIYGYEHCKQIWKERIASAPKDYYGIISWLLEVFFFK